MSEKLKIDVVCPIYRAESIIEALIGELRKQNGVEIVNLVFPLTESGEADAQVMAMIEKSGGVCFTVSKSEFSHSLTRERAIIDYCSSDVVIMMSQDIHLENDDALLNLAKTIDEKTVFAYGRQICKSKSIEYYTRTANYPETSSVVTKDDIDRLQLRAFFGSDAFSAYYRPAFLELGGYDHIHMMFNEDMYYAKKVLESGYRKAYVAEAVVEHSHNLTFKQLYDRYYATGTWFREHPEFDGYKTTDSGMNLAKRVLIAALKDMNLRVLIRFIPDMASRYLGMRAGKKA